MSELAKSIVKDLISDMQLQDADDSWIDWFTYDNDAVYKSHVDKVLEESLPHHNAINEVIDALKNLLKEE